MAENTNGSQGNKTPITSGQKPSGLSWSMPAGGSHARPATPVPPPSSSVEKVPAPQPPKVERKEPAKETTTDKGKFFKLVVGGVVAGGLLMWAWLAFTQEGSLGGTTARNTRSNTPAETSSSNTNTPTTSTTPRSTGTTSGTSAGSLSIPASQEAGFEVEVASASFSQPTWVVVYEERNGQPGNALGAALLFPESKNGTVRLLRATLPGQTYYVGQSIDNGDRTFSLQEDTRVRDVQGNLVWSMFVTQ